MRACRARAGVPRGGLGALELERTCGRAGVRGGGGGGPSRAQNSGDYVHCGVGDVAAAADGEAPSDAQVAARAPRRGGLTRRARVQRRAGGGRRDDATAFSRARAHGGGGARRGRDMDRHLRGCGCVCVCVRVRVRVCVCCCCCCCQYGALTTLCPSSAGARRDAARARTAQRRRRGDGGGDGAVIPAARGYTSCSTTARARGC